MLMEDIKGERGREIVKFNVLLTSRRGEQKEDLNPGGNHIV